MTTRKRIRNIQAGMVLLARNIARDVGNRTFLLVLVLICVLCPDAWNVEESDAIEYISYDVQILGAPDASLRNALHRASVTYAYQERPPSSRIMLQRRAENDLPIMVEVLQAEGYYAADIQIALNHDVSPAQVVFEVDAGPRYSLGQIDTLFENAEFVFSLDDVHTLFLETGQPARARDIIRANDAILNHLKENGYPHPHAQNPRLRVNHETHQIAVTFRVYAGPRAVFGDLSIEGLETIAESYVRSFQTWEQGELFNVARLERMRRDLLRSGLFATVVWVAQDVTGPENTTPIHLEITERPHRTVSAGVGYQTDEGFMARFGWEHRNFRGKGQRLSLDAKTSQLEWTASGRYTIPEFMRHSQALHLDARVALEQPDAYTSRKISLAAHVERKLNEELAVSVGIDTTAARVEQDWGPEYTYYLIGLPCTLTFDTTGAVIEPGRGGRLQVEVTPYQDLSAGGQLFTRTYISYSHFITLSEKPALVLALRAAAGTHVGTRWQDLAPDQRFYTGGGGSIRGFAYQTAGPLNREDNPIGGRSLFEGSVELRARISRDFGIAAFVDCGGAFASMYPAFDDGLYWGAGVGLRYFSPIGPLRLDIAFPLNRRSGIDSAMQLYAGIGHAF